MLNTRRKTGKQLRTNPEWKLQRFGKISALLSPFSSPWLSSPCSCFRAQLGNTHCQPHSSQPNSAHGKAECGLNQDWVAAEWTCQAFAPNKPSMGNFEALEERRARPKPHEILSKPTNLTGAPQQLGLNLHRAKAAACRSHQDLCRCRMKPQHWLKQPTKMA